MDGLTPGRIVHWVSDGCFGIDRGEHLAAIVTRVVNPAEGRVNLQVFNPSGQGTYAVLNVPYQLLEQGACGGWHWIERA